MTASERFAAVPHVDQDHVRRTVRLAIAETIQRPLADVHDHAALLDLGAQSLDFVELVLRLQQEHRITLPPEYAVPDDHTVEAYVKAVMQGLEAADDR